MTPPSAWCIVLLVTAAACSGGGDGATTDAAADADPVTRVDADSTEDTQRPASTLYVFKARSADDLVGGPTAIGQVGGAWIIGNAHARFMIQDVGFAAGVNLYGGNLVAADRVRPSGEADGNILRESFGIVDWRVQRPERAVVVDDGGEGVKATLRFEGPLEKSQIVALLDQVAGTAAITATIEYEVEPSSPALTMRTIITNASSLRQSPVVGDFLVMGEQLLLWTPTEGFRPRGSGAMIDVLASRGDDVSYAYRPSTAFQVPFVESSGTAAVLSGGLTLEPGESAVVERRIVVGDGTLASVLEPVGGGATVRGSVRDDLGGLAGGVHVSALPVGDGSDASVVANQTRTDEDGRFVLSLAAGSYELIASGVERRPGPPVTVTLADGDSPRQDLTIGAEARVSIEVTTDGPRPTTGRTAPVKVSLLALGDDVVDRRLGDEGRHGGYRIVFAGAGLDEIVVAPGDYRVVLSRGPEYERIVHEHLSLADGDRISGHLTRSVATPDHLACDFHQHTIGSLDSTSSLDTKLRENMSAGLECLAITDHDNIVDPRPLLSRWGAESTLLGLPGNEVSVNLVGHFNAYPLARDDDAPLEMVGSKVWAARTVDGLFEFLRRDGVERIIHVSHPRDGSLKGYFTNLAVNPRTLVADRGVFARGFDAIEVNRQLGVPDDFTAAGWARLEAASPDDVPVMADWFGLLNDGQPTCAIGSSDCHDPGDDCGYPRTYLRLGDDPAAADAQGVVAAIRAQQAVVSNGLWVEVRANGQERMGHLEVVDGSLGVTLDVRVGGPSWLEVDRVELYANGLFVESRAATVAPPDGDAAGFEGIFDLAPVVDTWYVVLARGSGATRPVFDAGSPFALTNPIYVDVTGDGRFSAPGPVPLP